MRSLLERCFSTIFGISIPFVESVFMLYDSYCEEQNRLQIFDCDDVAKIAKTGVASSTFLSQQRQIWYYGFYDLTQVQLDLFHAVAQSYTTSVYFPIVRDHPAYQFAQQFFDRHILGLSVESDAASFRWASDISASGLFLLKEAQSTVSKYV